MGCRPAGRRVRGSHARLPVGTLCLLTLPVSIAAQSLVRAQASVSDFYYHNGQQVPVGIQLDSMGILAQPGASLTDLQETLAAEYALDFALNLPESIVAFSLQSSLDRASLFALARQIELEQPTLVRRAGPLVRPTQGGPRLVLTDNFIVQFRSGVGQVQIDALTDTLGFSLLVRTPFETNHFLARLNQFGRTGTLGLLQELATRPIVDWAYPDFLGGYGPTEFVPNDTFFVDQWHLRNTGQTNGVPGADVGATDAWDVTTGSANVVIAIIEPQGFEVNHPDLASKLWANPGEDGTDGDGNSLVGDVHGWNFGPCSNPDNQQIPDPPPLTSCGNSDLSSVPAHGTAVAGLAAAATDNSQVGVAGMCPKCRLMLIRTGSTWYAKVNAFAYVREEGAHVVNASWPMGIRTPMENAVKSVANKLPNGIPVVFSMQNLNVNECDLAPKTLAALPEVIAVGSSNDLDKRISQSGFGSCLSVLAPGGSALSTASWGITTTDIAGSDGYNSAVHTSIPPSECNVTELSDPRYTNCFGGTSAAAPIVSGIIGLLLSEYPSLTRQQITDIIQDTADKIDAVAANYNNLGFSSTHGYGRVNAFAALQGADQVVNPEGEGPDETCRIIIVILVVIMVILVILLIVCYWRPRTIHADT